MAVAIILNFTKSVILDTSDGRMTNMPVTILNFERVLVRTVGLYLYTKFEAKTIS